MADPAKISSIIDWPVPINIKSLRGFLGLIGFYWKFIHHYRLIATPLTDLFKKNAFENDDKATKAFMGSNGGSHTTTYS